MDKPVSTDRATILLVIQSILEDERALDLSPRDIALLVLMHHEVESSDDSSLALTYSTIQTLHSRLDTLDARDAQGSERRLTESLSRLIKSECVARADMMRLGSSADTEYQITPLGDTVADWHVKQSAFSGEPLTAIFRSFIGQLARIAEDAEKAECEDDWLFDVVQPMQYALKTMLISIQRHQKELDRQHADLREFVPTLLTQGSEASIEQCEAQLTLVVTTIDDLQEVVLASTSRAHSLIEQIADLSRPHNPKGVEAICDELARRLQNIAQWTVQRSIDWFEHHNIVHHFLRTIVRVDRQRRITDALKRAVAVEPEWTLEVADELRFIRMRDDALQSSAPRIAPRLSKDDETRGREYDEVTPDQLPHLLHQYFVEDLGRGEARASILFRRASDATGAQTDLIPHFPWLIEIMSNAGRLDHTARDWTTVTTGIMIEEVKVTR